MSALRSAVSALVISDYRLREQRRGVEAISALRARHSLARLLITGDTAPERLSEAQMSGVPLLHKPVAAMELHQAIGAVLAGGTGQL